MDGGFFDDGSFAVDNLTKVFARESVVEYINSLISKNIPFSFAIGDIDNFKYVNDSYGHTIGDKVLVSVSKLFKAALGSDGIVGRYGGDEFLFVLPKIVDYDEVWKKCRDITQSLGKCSIEEVPGLSVTLTLGLARFPENETTYEKLLETADKALYRGKTKGRNCFIIYLPEKHANIIIKEAKEKTLNSVYLHSTIFRLLTKFSSLREGIENLFNFLSSYFMLDHICIQSDDKILIEKIHSLSIKKKFDPIPQSLFDQTLNLTTETMHYNTIEDLIKANHKELCECLKSQSINSIFCARISCCEKNFGILRIDSGNQRIWQYGDMDILLTTAKVIALLLYERHTTLKEIF